MKSVFCILGSQSWLGGFDWFGNNTFYWLNGDRVEDGYTHWMSTEPDHGTSDGMIISKDWSYEWGDIAPANTRQFTCQLDVQ